MDTKSEKKTGFEQESKEQEIQRQLSSAAIYVAKALRLTLSLVTGGLSKIGELLGGVLSKLVVGGIRFGALHGPGPLKQRASVSFYNKHKTGLLLLALVVGIFLLPFLFVFMDIFTSSSAFVSEPPVSPNQ